MVSTVVPKSSPVLTSLFPAKGILPKILNSVYLLDVLFKTDIDIVASFASVPSSRSSSCKPCFIETTFEESFSSVEVTSSEVFSSISISVVCAFINPSATS